MRSAITRRLPRFVAGADTTSVPALVSASCLSQVRALFVQCKETPNEDCMMFFARNFEFLRPAASETTTVAGSPSPEKQLPTMMTVTVDKANKHISPLAKRLFMISGVDEVTIGQRFVTVTRQTEPDLGDEDEGDPAASIAVTNTAAIKEGKGYANRVPITTSTTTPAESSAMTTTASPSAAPKAPEVKSFTMPPELVKPWEPPHWFDLQFSICAVITDHAHSREPAVELDAPHPHIDTIPQEGDLEVVLSIKELIATLIRPEIQKDGGDIRFLEFVTDRGEMLVELLGACKTCKSSSTTLADLIERTTRHWIPEVLAVVEVNARKKSAAAVKQSGAGDTPVADHSVLGGEGNENVVPLDGAV
jgi:Fe-S cluster biogenesis protein NfuA